MDYKFEEVQPLKICVYDLDNSTSSLEDDDFLGSLECTLGEVCVCMCVCVWCTCVCMCVCMCIVDTFVCVDCQFLSIYS